nr:MAG TPA: hypothetical protein [Caudoviricetes sp.]
MRGCSGGSGLGGERSAAALRWSSWASCERGVVSPWVGLHPVNVREVSTRGGAPLVCVKGVFV